MDLYFQKFLKFPRKVQTIIAQCNNKWHALLRNLKSYQVIQESGIISSIVSFVFVYTQS